MERNYLRPKRDKVTEALATAKRMRRDALHASDLQNASVTIDDPLAPGTDLDVGIPEMAAGQVEQTVAIDDRITTSLDAPSAPGRTDGDLWFRLLSPTSLRVTGMWSWDAAGAAWVQHELESTVLAVDQIWADTAWLGSFESSQARFRSVTGTRELIINRDGLVILDTLADGSTEELVKITATEIERLTIKNTVDDAGDVVIDNAGGVSAATGSFQQVLAGGEDLLPKFDTIPAVVLRHQRTSATGCNPSTSSVHNQPIYRGEFTAKANKLYIVQVLGFTATAAGTATRARARITATTDGTLATTSSPIRAEAITGARPSASSQLPTVDLTWMLNNGPTERTISWSCNYSAFGGVDNTVINCTSEKPIVFLVTEYPIIGAAGKVDYVGTVSSGGTEETPTAAPKQKTQTWSATGCNSWRNGAAYGGGTWMYQGYTPYDSGGGIKSSHCVFGAGSLGQSIPAAMGSATEIVKLEVYLYFEHWYAGSGGTANLYRHGSTAVGSYPGGTFMKSVGWKRNQGKWVEITDSASIAAFLSGSFQGITLSTGSTSSEFYGYARGTGSLRPKIRCTYMTTA